MPRLAGSALADFLTSGNLQGGIMFLFSFVWRLLFSQARPQPTRRGPGFRPLMEALEDRSVPAVLHVGSAANEYHTIQSAVNAAHTGDLVLVDPGTYQEQVTISKSITVAGKGNGAAVVVKAPTTLTAPTAANPDAILRVTGSNTFAEIENLTIQGAAAGTPNLFYGVRVDGGAFADLEDNTIANIVNSLNGQSGVAVDVGNSTGGLDGTGNQVGSAWIHDNNIIGYQRAGIVVNHAGSWADIEGNDLTASATLHADSQTGVEVSQGAGAEIEHNYIGGNTNDTDGAGVFLFAPAFADIEGNDLSGNDYGVFGNQVNATPAGFWCDDFGAAVTGNNIRGNTFVGVEFDNSSGVVIDHNRLTGNGSGNTADGGIYLFQSKNNLVAHNQIHNNNGSGIFLDAGSTGNTIGHNETSGNVFSPASQNADVVDLSSGSGTAGTANQWCDNQGQTFIDNSGKTLFGNCGCGNSNGGHDHDDFDDRYGLDWA
jgi:parallel beta-helix repeat protein